MLSIKIHDIYMTHTHTKKTDTHNTTIWIHHQDADKVYEETAWQPLYKNSMICIEKKSWWQDPLKTAAVRLPTTHLENHPN